MKHAKTQKRERKKTNKERNNKRISRCEDSPEQNECTKMSGTKSTKNCKEM